MSEWLDTLARNAAGSIPVVDRVFRAAGIRKEEDAVTDYGYARVSTEEQSVDSQVRALVAAGLPPEGIVTEHGSGRGPRPGLDRLLADMGEGDRLTVWRFDRLFRSTRHMFDLVDELDGRGIALRSLADAIDTSTSTGRFFFTVTSAIAQLEADLIRERTAAGLAAARARGATLGRPTTIKPDQASLIRQLVDGGMSQRKVARSMRLSRSAVGRVVRGEIASLPTDPDAAPTLLDTSTDLRTETP